MSRRHQNCNNVQVTDNRSTRTQHCLDETIQLDIKTYLTVLRYHPTTLLPRPLKITAIFSNQDKDQLNCLQLMNHASYKRTPMFRVLRPASLLDIPSDGWLQARSEEWLYPDLNLGYDGSLRLAGKHFTHQTITRNQQHPNGQLSSQVNLHYRIALRVS